MPGNDVAEIAAGKLLVIIGDAVRTARMRMTTELTAEELAALAVGPPPNRPSAESLEAFFLEALAGGFSSPRHA